VTPNYANYYKRFTFVVVTTQTVMLFFLNEEIGHLVNQVVQRKNF